MEIDQFVYGHWQVVYGKWSVFRWNLVALGPGTVGTPWVIAHEWLQFSTDYSNCRSTGASYLAWRLSCNDSGHCVSHCVCRCSHDWFQVSVSGWQAVATRDLFVAPRSLSPLGTSSSPPAPSRLSVPSRRPPLLVASVSLYLSFLCLCLSLFSRRIIA